MLIPCPCSSSRQSAFCRFSPFLVSHSLPRAFGRSQWGSSSRSTVVNWLIRIRTLALPFQTHTRPNCTYVTLEWPTIWRTHMKDELIEEVSWKTRGDRNGPLGPCLMVNLNSGRILDLGVAQFDLDNEQGTLSVSPAVHWQLFFWQFWTFLIGFFQFLRLSWLVNAHQVSIQYHLISDQTAFKSSTIADHYLSARTAQSKTVTIWNSLWTHPPILWQFSRGHCGFFSPNIFATNHLLYFYFLSPLKSQRRVISPSMSRSTVFKRVGALNVAKNPTALATALQSFENANPCKYCSNLWQEYWVL